MSDNYETKKFDQQNFKFPVDVLTENNEDKIGKACCSSFTIQRRYHTKSVFVLYCQKQR